MGVGSVKVWNNKGKTWFLYGGVGLAFLLFAGISIITIAVAPGYRDQQVWKGYYTLLVEKKTSIPEVEDQLKQQGFDTVIHLQNTRVDLFTYNSTESITLDALHNRLDPLDPRFDTYMKSLFQYFRTSGDGQDYNIFYVRDDRYPLVFYTAVWRALHGLPSSWHIADVSLVHQLVLGLLFLIFVLLLLRFFRMHRVFFFITSIPWLLVVMEGDITVFIVACLLYSSVAMFLNDLFVLFKYYLNHHIIDLSRAKLYKNGTVLILALVVAFTMVSGLHGAFLLVLVSSVSAGVVFVGYLVWKKRRQEHRLFFRVAIGPEKLVIVWKSTEWTRLLPLFSIITAALCIGVLLPATSVADIAVPEPVHAVDDFTWESLQHVALLGEGELPDLSDYIAHSAFQSAYLYNPKYRFPSRNEIILLSNYSQDEQKIEKKEQVVKSFTNSWYNDILAEGSKQGITRLLLEQGRPVSVTKEIFRFFHVTRRELVRYVLACLVVFAPLVLLSYHLTPQGMYGMKSLLPRRKSQAT
jgi:hypothetical protein